MARIAVLLIAVVLACCAACTLSSPMPDNERHGQVGASVDREKGRSTSVRVDGSADAWKSRDGQSRVYVDGHYSQGVSGQAKGQRDYGAGVKFEHKF